ncbi:hypothetical protein EDC01DRAFT_613447 [Geopyxis carbonaria]|nr:hypothetical protein EDC01DRAFT_613447 [Geopyxis carbonaria]
MQSIDSRDVETPSPDLTLSLPNEEDPRLQEPLASPSFRPQQVSQHTPLPQPQRGIISSGESNRSSAGSNFDYFKPPRPTDSPISGSSSQEDVAKPQKLYPQLQYHHQQLVESPNGNGRSQLAAVETRSGGSSSPSSDGQLTPGQHLDPSSAHQRNSRPISTYSSLSVNEIGHRGRSPGSPNNRAASSQSYDSKRSSYIDLTQPAHVRHPRPVSSFDNTHLKASIGTDAELLSQRKTLELYRANAKKTQDSTLQYELAVFMIELAQQLGEDVQAPPSSRRKTSGSSEPGNSPYMEAGVSRKELLREARQILDRVAGRVPQAQYYLADAYASGLFNKGKEENEKAFPLFVAASKHGHAEAGYRAGLCYEFGWGCRKDPQKAVQFYRQASSKNHPGAMTRLGMACLRSDLGLQNKHKEGVKWLKRATDISDEQYPAAPFELGMLHETGFGEIVIQDLGYAAQLFTQAAELGHPHASFRMGEAYEHGYLKCPKDAALSIHFYTGAAQKGHSGAQMALCAWYLVGAEPVLEKNEEEACAWAQKAAESGLPKAEYAVGYFTEMGIGCRRDPLEANVWYVKAADHGDERAVARLKIINEAASGGNTNMKKSKKSSTSTKENGGRTLEKKAPAEGDKGDCRIM